MQRQFCIQLLKKLHCQKFFVSYNSQLTSIECLTNKSIISVGGPDSKDFLQGHITNDINLFEKCKSMYSMILNHQGRVLYDIILHLHNNLFYMECDKGLSNEIIKHLLRYKLRKKVDIKLEENMFIWASFLKNLETAPSTPLNLNSILVSDNDPRLSSLCHRYLLLSNIRDDELTTQNCEQVIGQYAQLIKKHGIGEGPVDLPVANCLPLESNLDYLNGVSFEKGCYVGQELTARTHHTGVIRKRLMPLVINKELSIAPDSPVENGSGKAIGKVKSFSNKYGLGLLRIQESVSSDRILIKNGADVVEATTAIPAWWPQDTKTSIK